MLLLLGLGVTILLYNYSSPAKLSIERDRQTAAALAQAKAALIGYAVSVDLSGAGRPGDLPCPDRDNDGDADAVPICSGAALGRLPWKTLGLPDLRDGDGEKLWYAVSSNFKNNPRTACAAPGDAGCLNSDTRGTITVRNPGGNVINNGSNPDPYTPSGVIAVIIAPGRVLQRQGAGAPQTRGCTIGVDCDADERCTASPVTLTPKCNPLNYLDILSGTEDNAVFTDGSSSDGFIGGDVFDAGGNLIVNDRLITISYQDLMPLLERRVAREVFNCLNAYASMPQNSGRYPWAAPISDLTPPYGDAYDTRFGRIPDTLSNSRLGVSGGVAGGSCPASPTVCMSASWPGTCSITMGSWWNNWKEMVFYGVADGYKPADPISGGGVPSGGCGGCLTVDPPSSTADKRVIVAVAGKRLAAVSGGQPRSTASDKSLPFNYLEDNNGDASSPYVTQDIYSDKPATTTYNDQVQFQ